MIYNKDNNFSVSLNILKELNAETETLNKKLELLNNDKLFYSIEDIQTITGWSKKTVEDLFNNPAFPCTDIGKKKLVLKPAFINFFMNRRCKENIDFWDYKP